MRFFSDQLNRRIVANCFVSWILITASPVVRLAKFVVCGVIKAGHLCLIEFYGSDLQIHSTQQWGKYVLPLEKALPWREAPWETCRVRLWNKSFPCSNVIVVHVMSAWKAHCLLWQSRWTVPVCYSGQKYVENILDISLKLGHFGLRVDVFQNVTFVASFKLTLKNKTLHGAKVLRWGGKGEGSQGKARWALSPGQLSVIRQRGRAPRLGVLSPPCTQIKSVHPFQACMHAWKHKYILNI